MQYIISSQKKFARLLEKNVFKVVTFRDVLSNIWIFNSRFLNKIKTLGINKASKKSFLVVQTYNDKNKDLILTQSPLIQRISQCLFVCLTAIFKNNDNIKFYLKDIMQAYIKSTFELNQNSYIWPLFELISFLVVLSNYILIVIKPFYSVPKAGNHWFATYYTYHKKKLGITESINDPCLLYRSSLLRILGI